MAKYTKKRSNNRRDDAELDRAYQKISGKKRNKKNKEKVGRSASITVVCIALAAILVFLLAGYLYIQNAELNGIILENVYVAGVHVGGMTQAEAIEVVRNATANTYSKTPMKVTVLDSSATIPTSCVGKLDVRKAVKAAYAFGHSGSAEKKEKEQEIALASGYVVDLSTFLNLNTERIQEILSELGSNYNTTLSQSTYAIKGEKPNQKLIIQLGEPEYGLDLDKLYDQVLAAYSENKFQVEGFCGVIEPKPVDILAIHQQVSVEPVNASFDPSSRKVLEGKDGYGFDLEAAKQKIASAKYGATIEIPIEVLKPAINAENLNARLYQDVLATYTASADSEVNRNTNLRLACDAVNGKILYPGEIFSFNEVVGQRTSAKGYKPGPMYVGNETKLGIGGGICQVSSAIYYCSMISDMEILFRKNHGFAATYVPLGMDSTIAWGSIDFRFRNNSGYPIRIEASASGGDTTITFYGTDLKDYYVKMEYEVLNTENYGISFKTYPVDNPEGYKNGDYITEPFTGYDIKTYRCRYSKATNELLSRDLEASSTYRKRDGVICQISGQPQIKPEINKPGIGGGNISDSDGALPPA